MKSKDAQTTKNNYLAGPDDLQLLTCKFRSGLQEWRDEKTDEPQWVEIDGESQPLLRSSITEVLDYATEYTKKWKSRPETLKEDFKKEWFIDCRGLYILGSSLDLYFKEHEYHQDSAPIKFNDSIIDNCEFCYFLFTDKNFLGYAHFYDVKFQSHAYFSNAQFHGEVKFDGASFSCDALFTNCTFKEKTSFQRIMFSRRVDFSNTTFYRVPLFHETKFPQASSFHGAKFNKAVSGLFQQDIHQEVIAALRTLRQIAASYKGQQDEAMFFALEQRYYRKVCLALRLDWWNQSARTQQKELRNLSMLNTLMGIPRQIWNYLFSRKPVEWFISYFYDLISEYGSNPTRAVYCLFLINIVALLAYLKIFAFGDCLLNSDFCLSADAPKLIKQYPAIFFTLQNLLNPSSIISYKAVVIVNNIFMACLAIIQIFSTYIVLILAALAIKTRFQKGGSGGGDK